MGWRSDVVGMIANFFVATPEQALRYANRRADPDQGEEIESLLRPCEYNGFTSLEIGTLWAILAGVPWDVDKHMPEDTFISESGEAWLNRFPPHLTAMLAGASAERLKQACQAWANTEELACDPKELSPILNDLQELAGQARRENKSIYLWGCL